MRTNPPPKPWRHGESLLAKKVLTPSTRLGRSMLGNSQGTRFAVQDSDVFVISQVQNLMVHVVHHHRKRPICVHVSPRTSRLTLPCTGGGVGAYVVGLNGAEWKVLGGYSHLCEDIEQRRLAHIWQPDNPYLHLPGSFNNEQP